MVKMDLKDAYLQVPIHPDHQHLLSFPWDEKTYKFQYLLFGLSAAPRVFTKLLKSVVGFLRQNGCRLIIYLDDILMMHRHTDDASEQGSVRTNHPTDLPTVQVNKKKSILTPFQEIDFLGFHVCTTTMRLSIPPRKSEKSNRMLGGCFTRHQSR